MEMASLLKEDALIVGQRGVKDCIQIHLGKVQKILVALGTHRVYGVLCISEGV